MKWNKESETHLILHGGLGNQIFQLFKASLICKKHNCSVMHIHADLLGSYGTPRLLEVSELIGIIPGINCSITASNALFRVRLPKLINKILGREVILQIPFFGYLADGYFQKLDDIDSYSQDIVASTLNCWKLALKGSNLIQNKDLDVISHVRLGDFFNDENAAFQYALSRLNNINHSTYIVSDQEFIIKRAIEQSRNPHFFQLVSSSHMSSWQLFALLTRFRVINSNGSTLAFWASVLSCSNLFTDNIEHMRLHRMMCGNLYL